jgi:hypothetical protein
MIEHDVGVKQDGSITMKRLDEGYFGSLRGPASEPWRSATALERLAD